MKATKWIVGGGALVGIAGTFMEWMTIELEGLAKDVAGSSMPTSGMDNGGPIFIFFLCLPLCAAIIGILKRFGRGMGGLALAGGILSLLLAMLKYADISSAATLLSEGGMGNAAVAPGYWVLFAGSALAAAGGLIALIKPEPKPQVAPPMQPAYGPR
jgi:hypothetical protein